MKKVLLSTLIITTVMFSVFADNLIGESTSINSTRIDASKQVSLTYAGNQKLRLTVLDQNKGKLDIEIYDANTTKLLEVKTIKYDESFSVPIDLSPVGGGQYLFKIEGEEIAFEQQVYISDLSEEDVYATLTSLSEGRYKLKVLQDNTPVKVELYDDQGNVYHKQTHQSGNFVQNFDVSRLNDDSKLFFSIQGNKSSIQKSIE